MMLWIVAAVTLALLLGGLVFLALGRGEGRGARTDGGAERPRPGEERPRPGKERPRDVPPPSGVPMHPTVSEEISTLLESQELLLEEDDEPTGPVPKILLEAAGGTRAGGEDGHNEDRWLLLEDQELYAVADGIGGYAAGEVASRIAIETIERAFLAGDFGEREEGLPRRGAELVAAIRRANAAVREAALEDPERTGMGTTVVCARFSPGRRRAYVAHVGDSRCYRIRDGSIERLTEDHTLGAVGIQGPAASKLSRAVGVFDDVEVDLRVEEPLPGDRYLLCTDGLHEALSDEEILRAVEEGGSLEASVEALLAAASAAGGEENVSVVIVGVEEPGFDPGESGEHPLPG